MEKQDVELLLLKRIEELEEAHAHLKQAFFQTISQRQLQRASNSSCPSLTEAHYFNILQSIDEPVHLNDHKGRLIYRNPAWEKFYGYSDAESLGKNVIELIIGSMDATIADSLLQQILDGAGHNGEFVVKNKKGERFLAFGSSTPLRDHNGNVIGIIVVSCFPTPFPEIISPHPKVKTREELIDSDSNILSPKAVWKGNVRKGASFVSRSVRCCWYWLYDNDQQHGLYVPRMKVEESHPWVNTNTLDQWYSSFDKVYEIKWEDLMSRACIGRGKQKHGMLYHAVWYGSDVTLKLFPKQECSHDLMVSFMQEVSVMKRLRHPNILLFMGASISPHHVCIVTEFLCRGSLFQLLNKRKGRFNMRHRVHMALDIARGMNYLHCCLPPIIHCNLKSSNLRVDKNWTVKISDFGMCRRKHESKEEIGTPEWMAPEVLRNEEADEKSDVYSYGVVLWELTTEKIPWDGLSSIQVTKAVGSLNQRLDIPKDVDPQWASLIDRCLCSEPDSRPTFPKILDYLKELQTNVALRIRGTEDNHKC